MNPDSLSSLQLLSVAARAVRRESAAYLKTLGLPQLGFYILEFDGLFIDKLLDDNLGEGI